MKAKISFKLAALAVAVGVFAAGCGDGGGGAVAPIVATSNFNLVISPATAAAATAILTAAGTTGYSFPAGIPELGTTGPTTLVVTGTGVSPSFKVTETISGVVRSYAGRVTYGSCIFEITESNYPAPFIVGYKFAVSPCSSDVATAGDPVGVATSQPVTLKLGITQSVSVNVTATVNSNGTIDLVGPGGSVSIGAVTVRQVTGGN